VVNKVLQQYLRCFVHENPKQWGKFIHWAEWHYNTAIHTSTGVSPYQVVFGKPPPSLPAYILGSTHVEALDTALASREEILQQLKRKLLKAQETMKYFADKHRSPHQFKVGDYAFVKLRPYRQTSVTGPRVHKLAKKFYGPFFITRQIGEVAFELQLPDQSKIHPVFHVSQLKPYHGDIPSNIDLPPDAMNSSPVVQPLAVLNWRDNDGIHQVLIQWDGLDPEDTTWEP
ncbi:retrotransposon protein, partial [Trifolium medium]|nr:retrotransposon protein [Trifolium medium]